MAEEFRAAVCSRSWWMPPRTTFNRSSCSSVTAEMENVGPFWPKELMDMKSKSSDESSDGSMIFQDIQQLSGGTTTMSPDFAVQMRATAFSNSSATTTTDWDQNLFFKLHEGTFSTSGDGSTAMIEADHQGFTVDQQQSLSFATSSNDCTTFPIRSTSYGYPSSLVQSLFISNSPPPSPPPPPQQQPFCDFQLNSNNFSFVQNMPKRQVPDSFHLTNNTPFWNASASPLDHNISCFSLSRSSQFLPSSYKEKESLPNLSIKPNLKEIRDSGSIAKNSHDELPVKRRLETPSPLPTFKVRKEKLGDRITALQQLVSPFGKTDTASVLHEAIEYIKLLHDQVNILSAPYMKKGAPKQLLPICDEVKGVEGHKQDLRSLGLCLVPVPSRFPVATEMATRFWTPSYEGSFR